MINIKKVRQDTPGCQDQIFLNSAGASLVPSVVTDVMKAYLDREAQLGGYQTAPFYQEEINAFYEQTAVLLNCKPENIAFTYNATDAYSKALSSIYFMPGDYILTTDDDYISNHIAFLSLQKEHGIEILRINNLPNADLDLQDAEEKIVRFRPKLVAVTHIPTNSGKIQAVEDIGNLCEKHEVWYLVDACQSVGQIVVDVRKIKCDFLSATGRKFLRGPRGTGFLYVSDKALKSGLEPLMIDMRGAVWSDENAYTPVETAKRFEQWEISYACLIGLGEAVRYANHIGMDQIASYNHNLSILLKQQLKNISGITITENGSKSSSIVTFTSHVKPLEYFTTKLDRAKIRYSIGYRHFALIDFNKKNVDWVIRFSPHYFNTEKEISEAVQSLI
ncbi:MAG: aminotransferase class V-fold PLP-dependent enzyme [Saprospiraceae bacterium]|nr:aminotransferase class V-fold PLP-dependent enzyme [Saprospiraceae bacterium]